MNKARYIYLSLFVLILSSIFAFLYYGGGGVKVGYISDIKIDINSTIALYNKNNTIQKDVRDFVTQKDVFSDASIKEYVYSFRLNSTSKIFKKSDIFNVYPTFDSLPSFISNPHMGEYKYGEFTSTKKINCNDADECITIDILNDVDFFLQITYSAIFTFISLIFIVVIVAYKKKFATKLNNVGVRLTYKMNTKHQHEVFLNHKYFLFILFALYNLFIIATLLSRHLLCSLVGDDWAYTASYDSLYMPYSIGNDWQRGRHFADILMSSSMRPLGDMLVAFGIDPILAFNIVSSIFIVVFYYTLFIASSLLVYILNNNKGSFKLIFVLTSLSVIIVENQENYFTFIAAYIGSAGFSLLFWMPILYYVIHSKVIRFSPNVFFDMSILLFLAYGATFTHETASLVVFGLSFMLMLYMLNDARLGKVHSSYVYYYLSLFLILVPLSFYLTMNSGRADGYYNNFLKNVSLFEQGFYNIIILNGFNKFIIICGFVYLIYLVYTAMRKKYCTKHEYVRISILFVALLGIIGFSCIGMPRVWFLVIIISLILFLFVFDIANSSNAILSLFGNFLFTSFMVCGILQVINIHEFNFNKYFKDNSQYTLIELFMEADRKNASEIILTLKDIRKLNLEHQYELKQGFSNMSSWMQKYYTKNYIKIKIIDSNDNN